MWMNFTNITESERNQTEKGTNHMILWMQRTGQAKLIYVVKRQNGHSWGEVSGGTPGAGRF